VRYYLAVALAEQGNLGDALAHYGMAVKQAPGIDLSPQLHDSIGIGYANAGRFEEAIAAASKAASLAQMGGMKDLEEEIRRRIEHYRQGIPYRGPVRHTRVPAR